MGICTSIIIRLYRLGIVYVDALDDDQNCNV